MENARREAESARSEAENVRREAHNALQDMDARYKREDQAGVARYTRLRELELALELPGNEMRTLQREKESAAESAHDRARLWAANKSDTSSSGGARYYDISSGGTGASQPGVLNSLATNVFGYTKANPFRDDRRPNGGRVRGQPRLPAQSSTIPHESIRPRGNCTHRSRICACSESWSL